MAWAQSSAPMIAVLAEGMARPMGDLPPPIVTPIQVVTQ